MENQNNDELDSTKVGVDNLLSFETKGNLMHEILNDEVSLPTTSDQVHWSLDAQPADLEETLINKIILPASPIPEINQLNTENQKVINENYEIDMLESDRDENIIDYDYETQVQGAVWSEGYDAVELDPEDREVLIGCQIKATSSDSVAADNTDRDREFMYAIFQALSKELKDIKEQNNSLQNTVKENNDRMKINLNVFESTLRDEMQSEIKEVKDIKACLQNDLFLIRNNFKGEVNEIKNDMNKINEIKTDMFKIQKKLDAHSEGLASVSSDVLAAVANVEERVQTVGDSVEAYKCKVETLQSNLLQLELLVADETDIRSKENTNTNNRIDTLSNEVKESRVEMRSLDASQTIQVRVLQRDVQTLFESLKEVKRAQTQCQENLTKIEGIMEENVVQYNTLNNNLQKIDTKLDKVGEVIPDIVQHTLIQTLVAQKSQLSPNDNAVPVPRVDQNQLPLWDGPREQVVTPKVDNLPSIPSTPLLQENFVTPSPGHVYPTPVVRGGAQNGRNVRSDQVIADMVKRDKKPLFSGDNISPPIFLQEVEEFFNLIQISDDRDRLQLFPTFLIGNPLQWWKLISNDVISWEKAKDLLLGQYFNDYERQRYKAEWRDLDCKDFSSVEEFTLRGLRILNTIKSKDTEQKKCERVTVKLPEPLRDYLLNRQFTSTQDFLNKIKEAMHLKNFNAKIYFKNQNINKEVNSSASSGSYQAGNSNGNSHNSTGQSTRVSGNGNAAFVGMNPKYKGNPHNYIPNFRYPHTNSNISASFRVPPNNQNQGKPNTNGNVGQRSNGNYRGMGNGYRGQDNRNNQGRGTPKPRVGVNQVAVTVPPSPTPVPQSPPINHFHFTFNSDMFPSQQRSLTTTVPSMDSNAFDNNGNFPENTNSENESRAD